MTPEKIRIHDNEVHSYQYLLSEKTLVLKTSYCDECTDIYFINVLAYSFDNAGEQNCIYEIAENSIDRFVQWYRTHEEYDKALEHGYPISGFANTEELLSFLKSEKYRYYEVNASVGLDGFVIAKEMRLVAK